MLFYEFEDPFLLGSRKPVDTDSNEYLRLKDAVESIRQLSQSLSCPVWTATSPYYQNGTTKYSGTQEQEPVDSIGISTRTPADWFTLELGLSQSLNVDRELRVLKRRLASSPDASNLRVEFNKSNMSWSIVADKWVPVCEETKSEPTDSKTTQ